MAKKRTTPTDGDEPSFEEAMQELETLVRRLEQVGGALEQALCDYATAIGLLKTCNGRLEAAERRVEILSGIDAQGNPVTRPIAEIDSSLEEKQWSRSGRRSAVAPQDGSRENPTSGGGSSEEVGLF